VSHLNFPIGKSSFLTKPRTSAELQGLENIVRYGFHVLIHNQLVIDCQQLGRLFALIGENTVEELKSAKSISKASNRSRGKKCSTATITRGSIPASKSTPPPGPSKTRWMN